MTHIILTKGRLLSNTGKTEEEKERNVRLLAERLANKARGDELDIAQDIWFEYVYIDPNYKELRKDERQMRYNISLALDRLYSHIGILPKAGQAFGDTQKKRIIALIFEIDRKVGPLLINPAIPDTRIADGGLRAIVLERPQPAKAPPLEEEFDAAQIIQEAEVIVLSSATKVINMSDYPRRIGKEEFLQLENAVIRGYTLGKQGNIWHYETYPRIPSFSSSGGGSQYKYSDPYRYRYGYPSPSEIWQDPFPPRWQWQQHKQPEIPKFPRFGP